MGRTKRRFGLLALLVIALAITGCTDLVGVGDDSDSDSDATGVGG